MATLTNTKIKDTYDGLLKTTDNEALDVSGTTLIEDGLGNASALSVGRVGNGVTVNGLLDVTGEVQGTSLDINGAADISGNLAVDTNTLYVDAANNRVGINTLSPDESLELYSDEASVLIANSSGNTNSTSSVKFSNGSTVEPKAAIFFEDTLSNNRGILHLAVNSNTLGTPVSLSDAKLTINNSGNVGIGESVPLAKTHIKSGTSGFSGSLNSNYDDLAIEGDGNTGITFLTPNNNNAGISFSDEDAEVQGAIVYRHSLDAMTFNTAGEERIRIDSSGQVGIGSSNPAANLEVSGNATRMMINTANSAQTVGLLFGLSQSSVASVFSDVSEQNLIFNTGGSSERMRITSGGNVWIDATEDAPATNNTTGITFRTGGFANFSRDSAVVAYFNRKGSDGTLISFRSNGTAVGSISVTGSATAYNTSSDYRLKENVVPMEGALNRVDALNPSRFNFIGDDKVVDGFLAHEVAEVVPEAISGEKDAVDEEGNPIYQGIDQSKIVPLLVGAIKELKAEIELLKSQING